MGEDFGEEWPSQCPCNGIPGALQAGSVHLANCMFSRKIIVPKEAHFDYAAVEKLCAQQVIEPGTKFDAGKPPMELLSTEVLVQISRVLEFGKKKYDTHNWRKGMSWSRLIGAALRHLTAYKDGEDLDPETGLSHLAHLGCCTMFLLEFIKTHPDFDDRYKVVDKSAQK